MKNRIFMICRISDHCRLNKKATMPHKTGAANRYTATFIKLKLYMSDSIVIARRLICHSAIKEILMNMESSVSILQYSISLKKRHLAGCSESAEFFHFFGYAQFHRLSGGSCSLLFEAVLSSYGQ